MNQDPIAGEWKGDSICTIKDSPCRDEVASYQFKPVTGKPGQYSLDGAKIVGGERVSMGIMQCSFDTPTGKLECGDPQNGSVELELTLKDDVLTGALSRTDGRLVRRIHVVRTKG